MKKTLSLICVSCFLAFGANAQVKKNYVSLETGGSFGNNAANLFEAMKNSGFGKRAEGSFLGLFEWSTQYPIKYAEGVQYRIRAGRRLSHTKTVEAGYGYTYGSSVEGYDTQNYLTLTSKVKSIYIAYVLQDSAGRIGFGVGPILAFYNLQIRHNFDAVSSKNSVLPGAMITGFWNTFSKRS